ncbi:MAG: hypothetical protein AB1847_18550 [bacterium]
MMALTDYHNIRWNLKYIAKQTILRSPYVRHCSQTVYQCLLGCLRFWQATSSQIWRDRADQLCHLLQDIQRRDGGFDIGYDFNFGLRHRKGQSTSPELVGLLALSEYGRLFPIESVLSAAEAATKWIQHFARPLGQEDWIIPYSPYTTSELMVYNGISFAVGGLGRYLGCIANTPDLYQIYHGMVTYMDKVMATDPSLPGRFWYYNDQSRCDLDETKRRKIDYYHQMQQVEMHSLAHQVCPVSVQQRIIRDAADHIVALHERDGVVPYTNSPEFFQGNIHVWGLCSCSSGLLEAAMVIPERKEMYHRVAREIIDWIIKYSWNGRWFTPVLTPEGKPISNNYMIRSDAWVFNSLAAGIKHLQLKQYEDIAEICFTRMIAAKFSGPETHALSWRVFVLTKIAKKVMPKKTKISNVK